MARCPNCGDVVPSGCNCDVVDSTCFDWSGAGSEASPYTLVPILSADSDNLAECGDDGLSAVTPTSLSDPPAVMAYKSSHQSISNNTLTIVTLNAERYDTDSMHSTVASTSRITFTTAGDYLVTVNCAWNKHQTGGRLAQVLKNGADILAYNTKRAGGADLIAGHTFTFFERFIATDYVEIRVLQTSGGALLLLADSWSPFFSAVRVA